MVSSGIYYCKTISNYQYEFISFEISLNTSRCQQHRQPASPSSSSSSPLAVAPISELRKAQNSSVCTARQTDRSTVYYIVVTQNAKAIAIYCHIAYF